MLRTKEIQDLIHREAEEARKRDRLSTKHFIHEQIEDRKQLQTEAAEEYLKERDCVDSIIQRMIEEDREMARIQNLKCQQAQADMILSQNEKKALIRRQDEMESFENEMVRQYAQQQQERLNQIQQAKDEAEAMRDSIFQKLEAEEMARKAEQEFRENLRNELNLQENEVAARERERNAAEKRA